MLANSRHRTILCYDVRPGETTCTVSARWQTEGGSGVLVGPPYEESTNWDQAQLWHCTPTGPGAWSVLAL